MLVFIVKYLKEKKIDEQWNSIYMNHKERINSECLTIDLLSFKLSILQMVIVIRQFSSI